MKPFSNEDSAAITKYLVEILKWSFSLAEDKGFRYPWKVEVVDGEGNTCLSCTRIQGGEIIHEDRLAKSIGYPLMIAITDATGKSLCTAVKRPERIQ